MTWFRQHSSLSVRGYVLLRPNREKWASISSSTQAHCQPRMLLAARSSMLLFMRPCSRTGEDACQSEPESGSGLQRGELSADHATRHDAAHGLGFTTRK